MLLKEGMEGGREGVLEAFYVQQSSYLSRCDFDFRTPNNVKFNKFDLYKQCQC